jgi:hypothetical protein
VRALAGVERGKAAAQGPASETRVTAEQPFDKRAVRGRLEFSPMVAPLSYRSLVSGEPERSGRSDGFGYRVRGEWVARPSQTASKPGLGAAAEIDASFLTILRRSFRRFGASLWLFPRFVVPGGNWQIQPSAGIEYREFPEVRPETGVSAAAPVGKPAALGPALALEGRRRITDRWTVAASVSTFFASSLSGADPGSRLTASDSGKPHANFAAGAQADARVAEAWGIGFGARYETRSLSYRIASDATSEERKVRTSGVQLFFLVSREFRD